MDDPDDRQGFSRNPTLDDLVRLCKSLNETGVRYVVIGGFAIAHLEEKLKQSENKKS